MQGENVDNFAHLKKIFFFMQNCKKYSFYSNEKISDWTEIQMQTGENCFSAANI